MARVTASGPSNDPLGRWDALSLGTSSSTSGSRPDRSGTSGTTGHPSPAPAVENPSSPDQPPRPASYSVDSTDGSGHGTGSSPQSPSGSSEDSPAPKEATPAPDQSDDEVLNGYMAMENARRAYEKGNFGEAERLLIVAEGLGEDPASVGRARGYIAAARARRLAVAPLGPEGSEPGPSEADPAAGGTLVP